MTKSKINLQHNTGYQADLDVVDLGDDASKHDDSDKEIIGNHNDSGCVLL